MSTSTRLILLFLVIAFVTMVASMPIVAQESKIPSGVDTQRFLGGGATLYDDNIEELDVPFARSLITGRTVDVYVEDGDKTWMLSASVQDDMRIEDLSTGPGSEASTRITTDRETFETIAESPESMSEVRSALSDDCTRVNGGRSRPVDQVVWTVVNTFKSFFL